MNLPPLTQPVIVGVAIAYFAVVALIGGWAARRTRTARDFFVAGKGIGIWALALSSTRRSISSYHIEVMLTRPLTFAAVRVSASASALLSRAPVPDVSE